MMTPEPKPDELPPTPPSIEVDPVDAMNIAIEKAAYNQADIETIVIGQREKRRRQAAAMIDKERKKKEREEKAALTLKNKAEKAAKKLGFVQCDTGWKHPTGDTTYDNAIDIPEVKKALEK
jgi:autotransporter translocation and assembly factor TamB